MQALQGADKRDEAEDVRAYAFGEFRLDRHREELQRRGAPIALRPKAFDVLHYLVRHPGRVVSREELLNAVWPNLVVTDDSLTQCLIEIRKALGDEGREVIKTVPRRGYLFQAEVEAEGPEVPDPPATARASEVTQIRLPSRWTVVGLLVLSAAVAAAWWRIANPPRETTQQAADWQPLPASVAVLPFADMSEAGDQQYLADGIAEEILNLLAQSSGLTVIARTSSFAFKDANADIGTIARRLNVAHVLEGSVRKAGDRVRVTAQLVDGATGAHIWSETYEDRLGDVFGMQDRIAQGVAQVLEAELTGESIGPDLEAWEHYLRGRLFYSRRAEGDIMRAQRSFEEALAIDPKFADAWVSFAATINLRRAAKFIPSDLRLSQDEALPQMRNALERAVSLDPDNPEALWRLAAFTWKVDGVTDTAIEQIGRAMALGQNHALVQAMMGGFAYDTGHPELALPFIRRATNLDPVNPNHLKNLAGYLFAVGRFEEAEDTYLQALELNPGDSLATEQLTWIRIHQGRLESAAELAEQMQPGAARFQAEVMLASLRGERYSAEKTLGRLADLPPEEAAGPLAIVFSVRGDKDDAFRWLSIAKDTVLKSPLGRSARHDIVHLETSPFLRPLHDDARWAAWVAETSQLLLDEVDQEIVAMLGDYLRRHQQLYDAGIPQPDPP